MRKRRKDEGQSGRRACGTQRTEVISVAAAGGTHIREEFPWAVLSLSDGEGEKEMETLQNTQERLEREFRNRTVCLLLLYRGCEETVHSGEQGALLIKCNFKVLVATHFFLSVL